MYNLFKWVYERGVAHERLRIQKLIAEYRSESMRFSRHMKTLSEKEEMIQADIDSQVENALRRLTEPDVTQYHPENLPPAPIEGKS